MKMACPNCGGNVTYLLSTATVYCSHCGQKIDVSNIDIKEFTDYAKDVRNQVKENEENYIMRLVQNNNKANISPDNQKIYRCNKCHSEFIHSDMIKGYTCPFCFNESKVLLSDLEEYKVSKIIPFKLDRNSVANIICNVINTTDFAPQNVFATYVPFRASYDYITGNGLVKFNVLYKKVSVDENYITLDYAGKSINRALALNCINYDFSKCQEFNSKEFNQTIILDNLDNDYKRNEDFIKNSFISSISCYIQYQEIDTRFIKNEFNIEVDNIKEEIWLLPIYIYKEEYKGKIYTLLINGQNGDIQGEAVNHKSKLRYFWENEMKGLLIMFIFGVVLFNLFILITNIVDNKWDFIISTMLTMDLGIFFIVLFLPTLIVAKNYVNMKKTIEISSKENKINYLKWNSKTKIS